MRHGYVYNDDVVAVKGIASTGYEYLSFLVSLLRGRGKAHSIVQEPLGLVVRKPFFCVTRVMRLFGTLQVQGLCSGVLEDGFP